MPSEKAASTEPQSSGNNEDELSAVEKMFPEEQVVEDHETPTEEKSQPASEVDDIFGEMKPSKDEEEPKAEETPKETPAEEDAVAAVSDDEIQSAVDLGIEPGFARRMAKKGVLNEVVVQQARMLQAQLEAQRTTVAEKPEEEVPEPELPKLDPDNFDKEFVDFTNAQNDRIKTQQERLDALELKLSGYGEAEQKREVANMVDELDRFRAESGEEYFDVLGEGPFNQLPANSPHLPNIQKVVGTMIGLINGHEQAGFALSRPEAYQMSLRAVFPDKQENKDRNKLRKQLTRREGQLTTPPTHRDTSPTLTKQQLGEQNIAAIFDKHGEGGFFQEDDDAPFE